MRIIALISISVALAFSGRSLAQAPTARVAGLEKDSLYMELLAGERALRVQEDSINTVLAKTRDELRSQANQRGAIGARILQLENQVFDVRNSIGILSGQINAIEQKYIIDNMGNAPQVAMPKVAGTMAAFLVRNLDAADLAIWKKAAVMERQVAEAIAEYMDNYATCKRLADDYSVETSASEADSIYNSFLTCIQQCEEIAGGISTDWSYIFDNKSYLCNLLMDKQNNTEYLADAEHRAKELSTRMAESRGKYASDVVGFYPLEKRFVLESELALAQFVGDKKYADSLSGAFIALGAIGAPLSIELQPREFISYEDAHILPRSPYSATNPIPQTQVYTRGTVYRIQIGAYSSIQSPAVFRGATPVSVLRGEDGRYRYFAGSYRSYQLAEAGIEVLKRAGFRDPQIVVWENGVYSFAKKPEVAPEVSVEGLFRVEIASNEGALDGAIRNIIGTLGGGREISRIVGSDPDGAPLYTFVIGNFDSKTDADALAAAIRAQEPALAVKVTEVK